MGFALSPSVNVTETDLSTTIPAVATSIIGMAGKFGWGPCLERVQITFERELIKYFGKLDENNYENWMTAWNALQYAGSIYIVRAIDQTNAKNAGLGVDSTDGSGASSTDKALKSINSDDIPTPAFGVNELLRFIAKYPSDTDDIHVAVANYKNFYEQVTFASGVGSFSAGETVNFKRAAEVIASGKVVIADNTNSVLYVDEIEFIDDADSPLIGTDTLLGVTSGATADFSALVEVDAVKAYTTSDGSTIKFSSLFDYAPSASDEAVVVVFKDDEIVEQFFVSMTENTKDYEGNNIYIEEKINQSSDYIKVFVNSNESTQVPYAITKTKLVGGEISSDNTYAAISNGEIDNAYNMFANPEEFDVNILIDAGNTASTIQKNIKNICEARKDCFAILGVPKAQVVGVDATTANANVIKYRKELPSSSYAGLYNNWKYQYDKFNDKYRWVPVTGDVAGIFANNDYVADAWYAPAGFTRGQVKNVVKFAYNPNRAQRDALYKDGINPVVFFPGDGPTVFGQKTLQTKPSAFDRIDVRRLFIVLEKAISTASKYFLFEKNTAFTRRRIKGMIDPFLRDVKGREGIYDFLVVCDETNNTGEVIDRNELAVDIYIKPTRTAEFINLNFYATKTGVSFDEIVTKS